MHKMGVEKGVECVDVLGFDDDLLALLPHPCYALILCFPNYKKVFYFLMFWFSLSNFLLCKNRYRKKVGHWFNLGSYCEKNSLMILVLEVGFIVISSCCAVFFFTFFLLFIITHKNVQVLQTSGKFLSE